jgi:toxin-antitoxin system PIN domain toxin
MSSFLLPDVNVWVAINHTAHVHHPSVIAWFNALDEQTVLVFCRQTQMGLFRLLTSQAILGDETFTMKQCWELFAEWINDGGAELWTEPASIETAFFRRTSTEECYPKRWNDAYLAAFAETAGITLVTFDKALSAKTSGALLLP